MYTFTPPSGGSPNTPMFAAMKDDLYKRSKSIVLIKNPGTNTCFAKAFVLGLKQLDDEKEYQAFRKHPTIKRWTEEANALHLSLGLTLTMNVGPQQMKELADRFQITIHCFDVNGMKPGFSVHYPKGNAYPRHLYSFNYISNMSGILKIFRRTQYARFCELCNKEYFANRGEHTCSNEDDDDDTGVTRCVLKDRTLPFFPNEGEEKYTETRYIAKPKRKEDVQDYLPRLRDLSRRTTSYDACTY